ncbi:MAG TPA: hypothetical protein VKI65_15305, partial [Gemmataceae bacterium]|nr:hypothetical protein [Gemmataceae bacterium]
MQRFASQRTRQSWLRFVPRLEALEDRSCPSCTTNLVGNTLTVLGDQAANTIQLTDDGTGTIKITCDGGAEESFAGVTNIVLRSGASGDTVTYELTGDRSGELNLDIALQQGADQFNANLNASLLAGAKLDITVNAGNGADTLNLTATNANVAAGAELGVTLNGNNAKDQTTFDFQGNIDGQLELRAEAGNGVDSIAADVAGDIAAGGKLVMFFGAGNGQDSIA